MKSDVESLVKKHFTALMSDEVEELARLAWWDLVFGPHTLEDYASEGAKFTWPGYWKALRQIKDWAEDNLTEVWVDVEGGCDVLVEDPRIRCECEEEWEYHYYSRDQVALCLWSDLIREGGLQV